VGEASEVLKTHMKVKLEQGTSEAATSDAQKINMQSLLSQNP